ncbi:MAG: hypothetical protein GY794_16180 [bacterium]|nr:hypothetical protein [bacterium]
MGLATFLAAATASLLEAGAGFGKPKFTPASPLKDHKIIGKSMQGYLTGQHKPSMRPVTRVQYDGGRSKYTPHQGKQECGRRVRQMLHSI